MASVVWSLGQSVKCGGMRRLRVVKRTVHHMDMASLVAVNREVVQQTSEPNEFSKADGKQLELLLRDVESRADNQEFEQAIPEKASLLVYKLASGQHFKAGNKRTALVAGLVFLLKNGYKIGIDDHRFVSVVDRAGMAGASLDDVYDVMQSQIAKTKAERKAWEGIVKQTVATYGKFLKRIGSEQDDSQK